MTETENPWILLRQNEGEKALSLLRERYENKPNPSTSLIWGSALMWTGDYRAAYKHFGLSLVNGKKMHIRSEVDYALLGAAAWCLGDCGSAIRHWQAGRTATHAILGVCLHSLLLLFTASVLRPELPLSPESALVELREKVKDPRTKFWPGTLAQYVAGPMPIEAVQASWVGNHDQNARGSLPACRWLTEFYKALLSFHQQKTRLEGFSQDMLRLTEPSHFCSWYEDDFTRLLRFPELYIARHECRI